MRTNSLQAPNALNSVLLSRNDLAVAACLGLGILYTNAMFFRSGGINVASYLIILAGILAYFASDTRRSPWAYMALPVMLLFNENLAFGYLILLCLQKDGLSPKPLGEDRDLLVLLGLGAPILAWRIATEGVTYYPALGFAGRLEIGFIHPNLTAVWFMLLAYYAKHYWSRPAAVAAYVLFAASVVTTGSLGKIPLLLFFLCSGWLFRRRRIAYPLAVAGVVLASIPILLSTNPVVTEVSSGRNLIYRELLDVMGWKSLLFTVPQSQLVDIAALREFFGRDYLTAMPFDSVVSAATSIGILPTLLLGLAAGLFLTPANPRDFDRRMIFWLFGFASNPLSIWTPMFLFALKRSGPMAWPRLLRRGRTGPRPQAIAAGERRPPARDPRGAPGEARDRGTP